MNDDGFSIKTYSKTLIYIQQIYLQQININNLYCLFLSMYIEFIK